MTPETAKEFLKAFDESVSSRRDMRNRSLRTWLNACKRAETDAPYQAPHSRLTHAVERLRGLWYHDGSHEARKALCEAAAGLRFEIQEHHQ
jgi:hypothetical protein